MHPFYFLASFLNVIAICPAQAATSGDSVPMLEVFTTREQKVQSDSHIETMNPDQSIKLQVYHLDGIEQFESVLSKSLPTDIKQAKHIALQRLQYLNVKWKESMQKAAIGLTKAMQYGLDRYPAIVFDGQAVVYGVTDVQTAFAHYRAWRREGKR